MTRPPLPARSADLRLVLPAVAVWAGALLGLRLAPAATAATAGADVSRAVALACAASATLPAAGAVVMLARGRLRHGRPPMTPARLAAVAAIACLLAGAVAGGSRAVAARAGPVPALADEQAYASVEAVVTSDPWPPREPADAGVNRPGRAGDAAGAGVLLLRARLERVEARGSSTSARTPVLLVARGPGWGRLLPGQRVATAGRLAPLHGGGPAVALLRVRDPPRVLGRPGRLVTAAEPLREGLREAVAGLPAGPRGLVPALVVGDESGMLPEVAGEMRATGLAHLTAVSGANVAIVLGAVLAVARAVGVRGRARPLVGVAAVLGFVVLARSEPSVLRAAAMGLVAVAGLAAGGRRRGVAALAAAVLVLLLIDPWLAASAGFALSVLATGGILLLAPRWRDAAARWLPPVAAEAIAIPLAAQVACTPVVVALAGEVSLAALPANVLVAPAVAPATVLGAAAAVTGPLVPPLGGLLGRASGLPAAWIVLVADRGAALPGAAVSWPAGAVGLVAIAALSVAAAVVLPLVLRRRAVSAALLACLAVGLARPATAGLRPTAGWPPPGWVLVACQVGQGDALVIRTAPGEAVVVDAGPEPAPVDRCLDDLDIRRVAAVVLTHFHADHVGGLAGVLAGRQVAEVVVCPMAEPAWAARRVASLAAAAGSPVTVAAAGDRRRTGPVEWEVLWPRRVIPGDDGSAPNNASVVLDLRTAGLRVLLTGDVEPEAQAALLAGLRPGPVDVLKVPHHGSAYQHPALLTAVRPRVALVSVGAGNDYGHPAAATLDLLASTGARVARTDVDGSVAVVAGPGSRLALAGRGDHLPE